MIVDLTSPIELREYELLYSDNGVTRATLRLFNLSEHIIKGYSCIIEWSKESLEDPVNDTITVDALRSAPGSYFKLSISTRLVDRADRIAVFFTRVEFEDADTWIPPKSGKSVDIPPTAESNSEEDINNTDILKGTERKLLNSIAGDDAIMYPQTQNDYWRCVCGRINSLEKNECDRCKRDREYVLKELNSKMVHMTDEQRTKRSKREEKSAVKSSEPIEARKNTAAGILTLILVTLVFLSGVIAACLKFS